MLKRVYEDSTSWVFALALICLFGSLPSYGSEFSVRDWPRDHGPRARALYELLEPFLFAPKDGQPAPVTNGALVIYKGTAFYESYRTGEGFGPSTRHPLWSATKSLLHALVGVAVEQKHMSLTDPITKWIPESTHSNLTVENLLHMESCLRWSETYEGQSLVDSSVIAMLYGHARGNMAKFVWDRRLACLPGTHFRYSSGDSVLLSAVLGRVFSQKKSVTFPWTQLFTPIGASGIVIERDEAGSMVGSSFGHATLRDFARVGYLYLKGGRWLERQVLPVNWFEHGLRPSSSFGRIQQMKDGWGWNYGAHWWSNGTGSDLPSGITGLPADTLMAWGHWGQFMAVIPSKDLVILRVGTDRHGKRFPIATFLRKVVGWADEREELRPDVSDAREASERVGLVADDKTAKGESSWFDVPAMSSAFTAKTLCTCMFIANLPEEVCKAYSSQSPAFASASVDLKQSSVSAALRFLSWNGRGPFQREAKWMSDQEGCRSSMQ